MIRLSACLLALLLPPSLGAVPLEVHVLSGDCTLTSSFTETLQVFRESCWLVVQRVGQAETNQLQCIREICIPEDADECSELAPFAAADNPSATGNECFAAIQHGGTVSLDLGLYHGVFLVAPPVELIEGGSPGSPPDDGRD